MIPFNSMNGSRWVLLGVHLRVRRADDDDGQDGTDDQGRITGRVDVYDSSRAGDHAALTKSEVSTYN